MPKISTFIHPQHFQRLIITNRSQCYNHGSQLLFSSFTKEKKHCGLVQIFLTNLGVAKPSQLNHCIAINFLNFKQSYSSMSWDLIFIQIVNHQCKSVYPISKHPKIKACKNYDCNFKIRQHMQTHGLLDLPCDLNEKKNWHEDIGKELTYATECFRMLVEVYTLLKIVVVFHHHACKDLLSQKNVVIVDPNGVALFFPYYRFWFIFKCFVATMLVSFNFLFASKWRCATSICIFKGVIPFI